jgi:two-component system CheB/CheR fusion protein
MQLVDLATVVETAIESVQFSAAAKSIQLGLQLTTATVWGDVDRLQQVLWNLLGNAIKFTLPGGRVNVTVAPEQTDAIIQISDTGQGIEAELLPYVFDRFRQGDASTTKAMQGLGLGLSIVRYIVESHGGTVQAESPGSGQGTTMIVRLPLRSAAPNELASELSGEPASEPQAKLQAGRSQPPTAKPTSNSAAADPTDSTANQPLEAMGQASPVLEGVCILMVDDEVDNLDLLKYILEDAGADVVPLTSARDAIAALRAAPERYDVLLADIGMPDEDGIDLIRQVRALDAAAGGQIPAAAITAYVSEQEQQLAIDAGFQKHLAKPINPDQLTRMVTNLAGRTETEST